MASVELRHLQHRFGDTAALDGLDLKVESGDYVVLLGENGCGKTTAIRAIAGLQKLDGGSVFLDGRCVDDVPARHRSLAMVFQGSSLYPHLTADQNIRFGLKARSTDAKRSIRRAVEMLGAGDLLDRFPHQLSGGQLRRVAIAKAIAHDQPLRLFDEPLSALDTTAKAQLEQELIQIHRSTGGTTIHVTHDAGEAMRVADKIAVMHRGRLLQYDRYDQLLAHPNSVHVANRIAASPLNWMTASARSNTIHFDNQNAKPKGDWSKYLSQFQTLPKKILIATRLRGPATPFEVDTKDVMLFDAATGHAITPAVSR